MIIDDNVIWIGGAAAAASVWLFVELYTNAYPLLALYL